MYILNVITKQKKKIIFYKILVKLLVLSRFKANIKRVKKQKTDQQEQRLAHERVGGTRFLFPGTEPSSKPNSYLYRPTFYLLKNFKREGNAKR